MNLPYWCGANVLVTGYVGFLGGHLTRTLLSAGAKVVGVDIKSDSETTIPFQNKGLICIKENVSNYPTISKILSRYKITHVFHLAAEAIVGKCEKDPLKVFGSNIEGVWKVLEACRRSKYIQAIVCASSDKAYGAHDKLPYKEEMPLQGEHFYDVSKSCADLLARAYGRNYNVPVAVTRSGNIFGPGDLEFSRIVPDLMRSVCLGKTLSIRSDGKFSRDFVYVSDVVEGYLLIAENMKKKNLAGEAFNLSAATPLTVLELVKKVYAIAGGKPDYKILDRAKHEIRHQYLSSAKIRRLLNWKVKYRLESGLRMTLDWYRTYFNHSAA